MPLAVRRRSRMNIQCESHVTAPCQQILRVTRAIFPRGALPTSPAWASSERANAACYSRRTRPAALFRPGHADYTYWQKYGIRDYRGGGRQSARETAVRVAAGAIARKWLSERYGVAIRGHLTQLGPNIVPFEDWAHVDANPFFAANTSRIADLESFMDALRKSGDSCGARIEVVASGVPVGWGEPVDDKLDADIAHAMMSINAVKGVEIGAGFGAVAQKGTEHSDEMAPEGFLSNQAGGILGGISTGQDVVVAIAV